MSLINIATEMLRVQHFSKARIPFSSWKFAMQIMNRAQQVCSLLDITNVNATFFVVSTICKYNIA